MANKTKVFCPHCHKLLIKSSNPEYSWQCIDCDEDFYDIEVITVKPEKMDINKIIFSRTAPAKKVEIIKGLSQAELLAITPATVLKMVKEAGSRLYKSRDKEMRFHDKPYNNWNAWVEGVRNSKGIPMLDFYIQYENTDTNTSVSLSDFLGKEDYRGRIVRDDRYGNPRSYYFTYSETDKARFVKSLLLEYIYRKYKL